ncbi:MAG: two-component system, cell cycle response regulator [Deferribacteres bacterium]|jgi:diguanylate cyclase (GGDEF)-like protein|nr:hypothetical protein [Deferribacteraceae bacterium]MDK2791449.1 two-component system, cell cycle response regulator [Deferribacteres bacterium]
MKEVLPNNFLDNLSNNICLITGIYFLGLNILVDASQTSVSFLYYNIAYLLTVFILRYRPENQTINDLLHIVIFYVFIGIAFFSVKSLVYLLLMIQLSGIFLILRIPSNFAVIALNIMILFFDIYFLSSQADNGFIKAYFVTYLFVFYIAMYLKDRINKMSIKIEELSITDGLTGLLNQKGFFKKLEEEFYRSLRYKKSFCLIMIDSDDLKKINDSYGHKYGNMVIRLIADIIRDSCRRTDFAGRYGGDEYMICLVETDIRAAYEFSERLRKTIELKSLFTDKGKDFKVTVSVGISGFPESGDKLYEIVESADRALYMAKNDGKNRVKYVLKN